MTDKDAEWFRVRLERQMEVLIGLTASIETLTAVVDELSKQLSKPASSEGATMLRAIWEALQALPQAVAKEVAKEIGRTH